MLSLISIHSNNRKKCFASYINTLFAQKRNIFAKNVSSQRFPFCLARKCTHSRDLLILCDAGNSKNNKAISLSTIFQQQFCFLVWKFPIKTTNWYKYLIWKRLIPVAISISILPAWRRSPLPVGIPFGVEEPVCSSGRKGPCGGGFSLKNKIHKRESNKYHDTLEKIDRERINSKKKYGAPDTYERGLIFEGSFH